MRKCLWLLLIVLSLFPGRTEAQYGNEWIDFSKTYWKFKSGTEGILRISKATLDAAGVPSANGSDYVLYRHGREITLFVSNSGAFGSGDYIEFYATGNDGELDKELYLAPDKYSNDNISLFNDTAVYFLTVDNSSLHKRYTPVVNPIPVTPPAPSGYCRATVMANGRNEFSPGKTNGPVRYDISSIVELYSSQFDWGEGYVINWNNSMIPANVTINTPNLVTGAMTARLQTACIARARDSAHKLKLSFNGNLKADVVYGVNDIRQFDLTIPSTELSSSNTLTFAHSMTGVADIFGYPYWKLEYPRNWNFNGVDYMRFVTDASGSNQYVEVTNFSHGGTAPRLYDLTNHKYYTGDISVAGKVRFYLDPSLSPAEMVLFASGSTRITAAPYAGQRKFTNYAAVTNQGNYLLVTHKNLTRLTDGRNYIQEYADYRASAAGGEHTVVLADIEELYDQFAYGIYTHPLSITHFVDYGLNQWTIKPRNVFIIGKGVTYENYKAFASSSLAGQFEGIVPTYGSPGSDVAFVTDRTTWKMKANIGRLSAWNTTDVANYLNKIKAYEAAVKPAAFPTPASELWKKQVLHIAGGDGSTPFLQTTVLVPTLGSAEAIIEGPKAGAVVTTIAKNTKGLPTTIEDKTVDSLIAGGLSMITYYGHGSAISLDYNIKEPSFFNTLPKVPVFSAFGCDISTIYKANTARTITERYIAAPVSGATVAMASNNQGWTNIHSRYLPIMYTKIGNDNYGQTIGDQNRAAHDSFMNTVSIVPNQTSFEYTHMESFIMQGDPAMPLSLTAQKADYYVGAEGLSTLPVNITTASDSFQLKINAFNLGRAYPDTVQVKIEHINPEGKTSVAKTYSLIGLTSTHTTLVWIPIDKTKDLGLNKYRVTVDADARYDEISEANNTAMIDVFILSDNIVPVYPYNFSIVHQPDLTLKASTLNPFKGMAKYRIEIDTTELFNSPAKLQTIIDSKGGIVRWKPSIVLQDSVVYYWRTSLDSTGGGSLVWANSSFIFLKNGSDGWNQSHYFQYKYDQLDSLQYQASRKFQYEQATVSVQNINTVMWLPFPFNSYTNSSYNRVYRNGSDIQRYDCIYGGTLQVFVFDSSTGMPWINTAGKRGSSMPCFGTNFSSFSFDITTPASRNNARIFLDSIPNGNYVFVRNNISYNVWGHYYIDKWKDDTLINGSGISLYHTLRNLGFDKIDSFYKLCLFSMICKKGFSDYAIKQDISKDTNEIMDVTYTFPITDVQGKMNSVVVGPASSWKTLKWRTSSYFDTAAAADSSSVKVTGIDPSDNETLLYEGPSRDESLAFINAAAYPKLKLQWYSKDTIYHTAPQLDYWRVLYDPLPEAALNPAAHYAFTDSVSVGQLMRMETAIETLTELPMDSMLVRYKIIDANGVGHLLGDTKYRKLAGNDSLHATISFDPKPYPGKNYLFIEANPDKNQPEQYHPNNLGYIPFTIKTDEYNPVLDVTFDGTHILDRDIVSSKPFIKVLLRDENKFLPLKDTTSLKLFMRFPGDPEDTRRKVPYDGTVCKFIPADMSAGKNEAYIEYRPEFATDGIYQLYAKGEDATGNNAGAGNEYSISFEVINKSTITNLVNYPNPFSTSTAFVFTLTGWQIPTQFKIQILSVTGKVVREITKQELGPMRIGRNITDYKWDGKDQYGQLLGNGVYLYRVVTAINGNDIEHRSSGVDKFYKNGYSKMYIMR